MHTLLYVHDPALLLLIFLMWDVHARPAIGCTLAPCSYEVEAPPDVVTPKHLIAPEAIQGKFLERQPCFVPLGGPGSPGVCRTVQRAVAWEQLVDSVGGS